MDNKIIGNRINTLLAIRSVKQKELAKVLGLKDNIISYYCSGARKPNLDQIIEIAKYFNVSTDYLLGLTDITSTDTKVKDICEYTGLTEDAIDNIKEIANFNEKTRRSIDIFIKALSIENFISLDEVAINKIAIEIFKNAILKQVLNKYYPNIPNKEIEERGTNIFDRVKDNKLYGYKLSDVMLSFQTYYLSAKIKYSIVDTRLFCDIDYQQYILNKNIQGIISDALFEYYGFDDIYKQLNDYYTKAISIDDKEELEKYISENIHKIIQI